MYTLYCKEIHIFSLGEKYILKYFGITNNFTFRKHLYSVNDKNKTTFIQCCIKDILLKNSIEFQEFPIKMIKNNIVSEDESHFEELKILTPYYNEMITYLEIMRFSIMANKNFKRWVVPLLNLFFFLTAYIIQDLYFDVTGNLINDFVERYNIDLKTPP